MFISYYRYHTTWNLTEKLLSLFSGPQHGVYYAHILPGDLQWGGIRPSGFTTWSIQSGGFTVSTESSCVSLLYKYCMGELLQISSAQLYPKGPLWLQGFLPTNRIYTWYLIKDQDQLMKWVEAGGSCVVGIERCHHTGTIRIRLNTTALLYIKFS